MINNSNTNNANSNNNKIAGVGAPSTTSEQQQTQSQQPDITYAADNMNTLSYIAQRAEELEMDMNYDQAESKYYDHLQ